MLFCLAGLNLQGYSLNTSCHQKILKRCAIKFCAKLLPGETLCKFFQIFPPKDLVYRGRKI